MNRNKIMASGRAAPADRQAGLSVISWLLVIILAGLLALAAFRVIPAYIECARVGSALESLKKPALTQGMGALKPKLAMQLTMDSVTDIQVEDFKFVRHGKQLTISIDAPIRVSYIGNLGFVVQCDHSITVTRKRAY